MKLLVALLCTGSVFFCEAQNKTDPVFYSDLIKPENLKENLYQIAGPAFEGRETATAGQQKASVFIENQFKRFGLKPGNNDNFQLAYPVFRDSLVSTNIRIRDQSFEIFKDFDIHLSNAYTISFGSSEIVFAGYGLSDSLQDDYKQLQVAGKVVMVLNGYPPGQLMEHIKNKSFNPYAKQDAAQQHGAMAVLIIQEDFPHKPVPEAGKMYRKYFQPKNRLNSFYISERIARSIMGSDYDKAKTGSAENKIYTSDIQLSIQKQTEVMQSTNVLGLLEGSDLKDEILVISAHYDHLGKKDSVIYFGADDDGSGTVSLIELAAAFSRAKTDGKGPRRSILFLANSGEEKGLWGSEWYSEHPVFPIENTIANLNTDMIGRTGEEYLGKPDSANYIYSIGSNMLSSDLGKLSEQVNATYTKMKLDYKYDDPKDPERIYYRSDHYNFAKHNIPIIFYYDGMLLQDYHRPGDEISKINFPLLAKRAKLTYFTAWELANRAKRPVVDMDGTGNPKK